MFRKTLKLFGFTKFYSLIISFFINWGKSQIVFIRRITGFLPRFFALQILYIGTVGGGGEQIYIRLLDGLQA